MKSLGYLEDFGRLIFEIKPTQQKLCIFKNGEN